MARLTVNGAALDYQILGQGNPLVLVHGSASDYRTWRMQQRVFAESFRVVNYSRRYHWPNDPIPNGIDYSMDQHVADLRKLIRSLDVAPAHLVGHSYGAFVCLLVALRDPELVRTLVLSEPPVITLFVSNHPRPAELVRLLVTRPRTAIAVIRFGAFGAVPARKAFEDGDDQRGLRIFGNAVLGPGGYDRLSEIRKAQIKDNLTNVRAELLGSGFTALTAEQLRTIDLPALLITGERSVNLFHRLTDSLEALLPRASHIEIPGAAHMMHEENASAYNEAVVSFLDRSKHRTNRNLR